MSPRKIVPTAAAALVASALVATVAFATGTVELRASTKVIHACVNKKTKAVRIAGSCRRGEYGVKWNVRGVRGLRGFPGAKG